MGKFWRILKNLFVGACQSVALLRCIDPGTFRKGLIQEVQYLLAIHYGEARCKDQHIARFGDHLIGILNGAG